MSETVMSGEYPVKCGVTTLRALSRWLDPMPCASGTVPGPTKQTALILRLTVCHPRATVREEDQ